VLGAAGAWHPNSDGNARLDTLKCPCLPLLPGPRISLTMTSRLLMTFSAMLGFYVSLGEAKKRKKPTPGGTGVYKDPTGKRLSTGATVAVVCKRYTVL
jgi:hypothetical protein